MHELSVTQAILETACRHADRAGVTRIHALDLRVGSLSGLSPESISFYFDLISRGTIAAGARLRFEQVPPHARCRSCGATRDLNSDPDEPIGWLNQFQSLGPCGCKGENFELEGGTGCFLDSMEAD